MGRGRSNEELLAIPQRTVMGVEVAESLSEILLVH
jgi:hypothetical protein